MSFVKLLLLAAVVTVAVAGSSEEAPPAAKKGQGAPRKYEGRLVTHRHKLRPTVIYNSNRQEGANRGGGGGGGGFPDIGGGIDAGLNAGAGGLGGGAKGGFGPDAKKGGPAAGYLKPYNANGPRGLYADESLSSDSLQGIYRLLYDLIINFHNAEQSLEKGVRDKESDGIAAMIKDIIGSQGLLGKILGMAGGGGGGLG